jgi:HMG (high mobility group) box
LHLFTFTHLHHPLLFSFSCGHRSEQASNPSTLFSCRNPHSYKMGPSSLSISLSSTTPLSLNPSHSSAPLISPPVLLSQNTIMSALPRNNPPQGGQPPRPPNAWILYRSDKLQQLPPPALGQPKPTQAEVSKIISAQWRSESDQVRAHYDHLAEMAKAEHARLYPNYRFAPMKKAEKDRIREEKRQAKAKEQERVGRRSRGRPAPYPPPCTASTSTAPAPLVFKHVLSDPKDPSPPLSSASSPSTGTPPSHFTVNLTLRHNVACVSPDASVDPTPPPLDPQGSSSRGTCSSKVSVPVATPIPAVPFCLRLSTPQPSHRSPRGWSPSPELDSTTTTTTSLSPLQDFSLADWPQALPHSTEVPLEARATS